MTNYKVGDIVVHLETYNLEEVAKIKNKVVYTIDKTHNLTFKYSHCTDYANDINCLDDIVKYTNMFKYLYCDLIGQY